jgi:Protein of unknown function (DUF4232)
VITTMRTMLIAVTGAVLLAAAGGVAASASQGTTAAPARATAATSTAPRCYTQYLATGLHGFQAGLGNRGFILTLTNTGSTSCSLSGYPGLGLQNARHRTLPSQTFRGSTYFDLDPGRSLIVLSPGETVSADLAYAADGMAADSVTATYLEVTPPNAHLHLTVRIPGAPVVIYHGNLYVTAVARHTPY